jgi:hypothetical protein
MAAAQDIFHSSLDTRVGPGWIRLGENVAVDLSVVAAERALETSPAHLANLVKPSYDYVGIGVAHGADGGVYVVQDFGSRAAGAVAPPSPPKPRPAAPRTPAPAPVRRAAPPGPSPPSAPYPSTPSRPLPPLPPPPPPEPPQPSVRLVDVFVRLRALDAGVTQPLLG